jgi:hypothetical protein
VNEAHHQLCGSVEWGEFLATEVLPRVMERVDLGDHLLEVGPGFGLATDVLRTMVPRVTAVEIDPDCARDLAARFEDTNVEVGTRVTRSTQPIWPSDSSAPGPRDPRDRGCRRRRRHRVLRGEEGGPVAHSG